MNSHQRRKASRAALAYVGGVGAKIQLPTGAIATVVGRPPKHYQTIIRGDRLHNLLCNPNSVQVMRGDRRKVTMDVRDLVLLEPAY